MGRVFVAGSINMDVVATADRHPRIGETVAGQAVLYFPGGKGANQAVAAAKLGAQAALIGRLGQDAFGDRAEGVSRRAGNRPQLRAANALRPIPERRIITVANADNTIVVDSRRQRACRCRRCRDAPVLAKGDIAVSQFEIPLPTIAAFFARARAAGATTILNPAPAIEFDRRIARSRRHPDPQRNRARLAGEDRTSRHRRSARFIEAARSLPAGRRQDHLRDTGPARRARADRRRAADHRRPRRQGHRYHRRRRLLCRRGRGATRWRQCIPMRVRRSCLICANGCARRRC